MWKKLVGRFCRWVHRISGKYCKIESNRTAKGLAKCLVLDPLTKEQKEEECRQRLLRGVDDKNKDKVIDHLNNLSKEIDPLENTKEIPDNSVKKVGINILVKDVQNRYRKVREEIDENESKRMAEEAIRGLRDWPVSPDNDTKRRK